MRFIILLVAGAFATDTCNTAGGLQADNTCWDDADGTSKTEACTATTCVFTRTPAQADGVAAQWNAAWDAGLSYCNEGTALVAGDNCAHCKELLECAADYGVAAATAMAVTDPVYVAPTTCKEAQTETITWGAAVPACAANAAWNAADAPTCAADDGAVNTLVQPTTLYGPTGTECIKATYDKCVLRATCAEFATAFAGTYSAPTTAAPSTTDSSTSPAAMISAGIALLALLF